MAYPRRTRRNQVRPLRGPGPGGCLPRGLDRGHRRAARGELRGTQGGAERALALEGGDGIWDDDGIIIG